MLPGGSKAAYAIVTAALITGFGSAGHAQQPVSQAQNAPAAAGRMVPLSDIEMELQVSGGDGCSGRSMAYRLQILGGAGLVTYTDFGGEPRDAPQQREISTEEIVAVLNQFLRARFLDAQPIYTGCPVALLRGASVQMVSYLTIGASEQKLSLRIGAQRKDVSLFTDYPTDLGQLRDRLVEIGGPKAWRKN
jgi:hypothetical protein